MNNAIQIRQVISSINSSCLCSPWRRGLLLVGSALALAWLALAPPARAVCQDGCDLSHNSTFQGDDALVNNTTGFENMANGFEALFSNTTGFFNTATGALALRNNTTGNDNTANGFEALDFNTGSNNTANGSFTLANNTTGNDNTAIGIDALLSNTTGIENTASGASALSGNTTGGSNTANGFSALLNDTNGSNNTAVGNNALLNNTTGASNIALGVNAGSNLTTGTNNIDIGATGVAGESKKIRIGVKGTQTATIIAGINGVTVAGGVNVIVNSNGQLGTVTSSARFKENIQPMDKTSEALFSLQPVTFRYKKELDPQTVPQFGLVAEQVEKVNPDLIVRGDDGKPYTVRYEAVNAMLLNEFLKEHRKVAILEATVAELKSAIKDQATQIQKVNARIESAQPRQRLADNQ